MKTERGFEIQHFKDSYGESCSIQESSNIDPHIWLGIDTPKVSILYSNLVKYLNKPNGMMDLFHLEFPTAEQGWGEFKFVPEVFTSGRMHLNRDQARELANKLLYFADNGTLKEE